MAKTPQLYGFAFLLGAALAGCGDGWKQNECGDGTVVEDGVCVIVDPTMCGAGTTLQDGVCVPTSTTTCGAGTTLQGGMCVANPPLPPTICGPGTVLQGATCVIDPTAPGPVAGLAATVNGSNIDLAWTAGAGASGTLIARLVAGAEDAPAPHTPYAVGQTLPGGATVVAVGSATTASLPFTTAGRYTYMAWPINASGNYGFGREVSIVVGSTTRTGTLSVDVANTTGTVTAQPAGFPLAVTNVAYDSGTGTLALELAATNETAGHFFNTKAVITSTSTGTVDNPDGQRGSHPFVQLGFAAQLPTVVASRTIQISGVGATDTVTIELEIVESGLGITGVAAVDLDGGFGSPLDLPQLVGNKNDAIVTSVQFSPSGRYAYLTNRWTTALFRIDTASGDVTAIQPATGLGHGDCLYVGADGFAYAVYGLGTHFRRSTDRLAVAKIDLSSLTTVATTTLNTMSSGRLRTCAHTANRLAIPFGQAVYLFDPTAMAFVDTDSSSAMAIDPITPSSSPRGLAYAPGGGTLYYVGFSANDIHAIDTTTYVDTTYHAASDTVHAVTVDAAGNVWWGQSNGLYSFDGVTETQVPNYNDNVYSIARVGTTDALVGTTGSTAVLSLADGSVTRQGSFSGFEHMGHAFAAFEIP
jgi:hypothetical protein